MKLPTQIWNAWGRFRRSGWVGAVAASLLGLLLLHPAFPWLHAWSFDLSLLLRPNLHPDEALLVLMDEESHRRLGQRADAPWDRRLHAQLLDQLRAGGAEVIVFDILFDAERPEQDAVFASALQRAKGHVVLASIYENQQLESGSILASIRPVPMLETNASSGIANLIPTEFGIIRRHSQASRGGATDMTLGERAAQLVQQMPDVSSRSKWINYYGPPQTIPSVSYHAVLSNALPSKILEGRAIFVGRGDLIGTGSSTREDLHRTPHFWTAGREMAGVEIQSTLFLNLVRKDWLNDLGAAGEMALILIAGTGFGAAFARVGRKRSYALLLISFIVIPAAAITLLIATRIWIPWLIICAVQVPVALAFGKWCPRKSLHDVFISYRKLDAGYALWLRKELESCGYNCFLDLSGLTPGNSWRPELENAISAARAFLIILSPRALDRCWEEDDVLTQELIKAFRLQKPVMAVLLHGFNLKDLNFQKPPVSMEQTAPHQRQALPRELAQLTLLAERECIEHSDKLHEQTVQRLISALEKR